MKNQYSTEPYTVLFTVHAKFIFPRADHLSKVYPPNHILQLKGQCFPFHWTVLDFRASPPVQECTELPRVLQHANEVLFYCRDYHEHGDFQKGGGHKNSHPLPSHQMTNGNSEKAADEWAQAWQAGILADTN